MLVKVLETCTAIPNLSVQKEIPGIEFQAPSFIHLIDRWMVAAQKTETRASLRNRRGHGLFHPIVPYRKKA